MYKQLVTPNLDPVVYNGGEILLDWYEWCLATVETAFGTPRLYPTAWKAYEALQHRHEDRNFPGGVYFPIWFSGSNGDGHVAFAFINSNGSMGIWTSPYRHTPYFFTGYTSVDALAAAYHVTFVGWSEDLSGVQLIEYVADPAPVAPAAAPQYDFIALDEPINAVVNKNPTHVWDFTFDEYANAHSVEDLTQGSEFVAVGKVQRNDLSDKPLFFLRAEQFNARTPHGVRSVDLTIPTTPAPQEVVAPVVEAAAVSLAEVTAAPAVVPVTDDNHVEVKVNPPTPDDQAWKKTLDTKFAGLYYATASPSVHDGEGNNPDMQLVKGKEYTVAGKVTKDFIEYYVTVNSVKANRWYLIPIICLDKDGDIPNLAEEIVKEIEGYIEDIDTKTKTKFLKTAGELSAVGKNFTSKFKKKK